MKFWRGRRCLAFLLALILLVTTLSSDAATLKATAQGIGTGVSVNDEITTVSENAGLIDNSAIIDDVQDSIELESSELQTQMLGAAPLSTSEQEVKADVTLDANPLASNHTLDVKKYVKDNVRSDVKKVNSVTFTPNDGTVSNSNNKLVGNSATTTNVTVNVEYTYPGFWFFEGKENTNFTVKVDDSRITVNAGFFVTVPGVIKPDKFEIGLGVNKDGSVGYGTNQTQSFFTGVGEGQVTHPYGTGFYSFAEEGYVDSKDKNKNSSDSVETMISAYPSYVNKEYTDSEGKTYILLSVNWYVFKNMTDGFHVDGVGTWEAKNKDVTVNYYVTGETTPFATATVKGDIGTQIESVPEQTAPEGFKYTLNEEQSTALPYTVVSGDSNAISVYYDKEKVVTYTINYNYYSGTGYVKDSDSTRTYKALNNEKAETVAGMYKTYEAKPELRFVGQTINDNVIDLYYVNVDNFINVNKQLLNTTPDENGEYTLHFDVNGTAVPSTGNEGKTVVLVIDTSISMAQEIGMNIDEKDYSLASSFENTRWYAITEATRKFVDLVIPDTTSKNKVALVTYNENAKYSVEFTNDKSKIVNCLERILNKQMFDKCKYQSDWEDIRNLRNCGSSLNSGTNISAGLKTANDMIDNKTEAIVVLMTDGEANKPDKKPIEKAQEAGEALASDLVTIYSIAMLNVEPNNNVKKAMGVIGSNGGAGYAKEFFGADDYAALSEKFAHIAAEFLTFPAGVNGTVTDTLDGHFTWTDNTGATKTFDVGEISVSGWSTEVKIKAIEGFTGLSYTNNGCKLTYNGIDLPFSDAPIAVVTPNAVNDSYEMKESDKLLTVNADNGVMVNDSKKLTDELNVNTSLVVNKKVSNVKGGTVTMNPDGSFTVTRRDGNRDQITFTYTLEATIDGKKYTDTADVVVEIKKVEDVKVETYLMGVDGKYSKREEPIDTIEDQLVGSEYSVNPKAKEGFTFDAGLSTVSGVVQDITGLTLKLYYARNQYTVTYAPGEFGGFAPQTYTVFYEAATPNFSGQTVAKDNKHFYTGWDKAIAKEVTGNVTYTAQWQEKNIVTISSKDTSKVYDGTPLKRSDSDYSVTGYINDLGYKFYFESTVSQTNAGTVNEQSENLTLVVKDSSGVDKTDYFLSRNNIEFNLGSLTVTPRPVTVKATNTSRQYGKTNPLSYAYSVDGVAKDEKLTGILVTNSKEDELNVKRDVNGAVVAYENALVVTVEEGANPNYAITPKNGDFTIIPSPITLTADDAERMYGSTKSDYGFKVTKGEVYNNDAINATVVEDKTKFSEFWGLHENVLVVNPGSNPNYTISVEAGDLNIAKKPLTITANDAWKYYNDPEPTYGYTIGEGLVAGDNIGTIKVTRLNVSQTEVGIYENALFVSVDNANPNYSFDLQNGDFEIKQKGITITPVANGKVYGEDDPSFDFTVAGADKKVFQDAVKIVREEGNNVGNYAMSIEIDTAKFGNYAISTGTANFAITKRNITVSAKDAFKTYGDGDPSFGYEVVDKNQFGYTDTLADLGTLEVTRPNAENDKNVATYADALVITAKEDTLNGNYKITLENGDFTINKRIINVTADNKSKEYGANDPDFTYTADNSVVAGDNLGFNVTRSEATKSMKNVGDAIELVVNYTTNNNYTINATSGRLNITPKDITVTADSTGKVYGENDPAEFSYKIGAGVLKGESVGTITVTRKDAEINTEVGAYLNTLIVNVSDANPNYHVIPVAGTFTISKKDVYVTANSKVKVYGDADPELDYTITNAEKEVIDAIVNGIEIKRVDDNTVGKHDIVLTVDENADNHNYNVIPVNGTITINPMKVNVYAVANSKTYGAVDPALEYEFDKNLELPYEDTLANLGTFEVVRPGKGTDEDAKTYTDALEVRVTNANKNYDINPVAATFTINKKPIMIAADMQTITYGDKKPETTTTKFSTPLVHADDIQVTVTKGTSWAGAKDARDYANAYVVGYTEKNGKTNYDVTLVNGTLRIIQRTAVVTIIAPDKFYGEEDPEFTPHVNGILPQDQTSYGTVKITRSKVNLNDSTDTDGENVGKYKVSATVVNANGNYFWVYNDSTLTILQRPITIKATPAEKVYGEADDSTKFSYTFGNKGILEKDKDKMGTITVSRTIAGEDAKTYQNALTVSVENLNPNYVLTEEPKSADFTITKRPLEVAAVKASKVYGATNPDFNFNITSGTIANDLDAAALNIHVERTSNEETAKTYTNGLKVVYNANNNYEIKTTPADFIISQRAITISANDVATTYGDEPILGFTVSEELSEDLGIKVENKAGSKNAGTYLDKLVVTYDKAADTNYAIQTVDGTLTINPRPIDVSANNASKNYSKDDPTLSFTANESQLAAGDTLKSLGNVSVKRNGNDENVGTYDNVLEVVPDTTVKNYKINGINGDFTINPLAIQVKAKNYTKTYGEADPAELGYDVIGAKSGDTINGITVERVLGENVGKYDIIVTINGENKNYTVTPVKGTLTISKKMLQVAAVDSKKTYGDEDPAFDKIITGEIIGNDAELMNIHVERTGLGEAANSDKVNYVGALTVSYNDLGNYDVRTTAADFVINRRPITITADPATKTYGDPDAIYGYTYSEQPISGNDFAVKVVRDEAAVNADIYDTGLSVTYDKTKADNYDIKTQSGKLTIVARDITVSANDQFKTYADENPKFTYTVDTARLAKGDTEEALGTIVVKRQSVSENAGFYEDDLVVVPDATVKNYKVNGISGDFTINQLAIKLIANDAEKIYGDVDPEFSYRVEGTKETKLGEFDFKRVSDNENAGKYANEIEIIPISTNSNFAFSYEKGELEIVRRLIDISVSDNDKNYGNEDPDFWSNYSVTNLASRDTKEALEARIDREWGEEVGKYGIEVRINNDNYVLDEDGSDSKTIATFTINPRPVTITVDSKSIVQGNVLTPAEVTYTVSGNDVSGNILNDATLVGLGKINTTISGNFDNTTAAGVYRNVLLANEEEPNENYDVTMIPGNLTITVRPVTITNWLTIYGINEMYNGASHAMPAPTISDGVGAIYYSVNGSAATTAEPTFVNAGTYSVYAYADTPTGRVESTTTVIINPAPVVVTANSFTIAEGDADPTFTGTVAGLLGTDSIGTVAYNRAAGTVAGNYAITPVVTNANPNYSITYVNGALAITEAPANPEQPVEIPEEQTPLAPSIEETPEDSEQVLAIDEEEVPLAAGGNCWIHWLILGITLLYAIYAVMRGYNNNKEIEEAEKKSKKSAEAEA